jgi:REP element-mobilizing transposase RayT
LSTVIEYVPMTRRSHGGQLQLAFGGRSRKRVAKRRRANAAGGRVAHARRQVSARCPLHVTLRVQRHVWQLRSRRCFRVLERAFYRGNDRFGGRVCHFSVQHNHIHLIVEADDARALARALQGLSIRMAKGLNRVMGRHGGVFADRYHARSLRTPTEVRNVLVYVLANRRKHRPPEHPLRGGWLDPCSSSAWFEGFGAPHAPRYYPGPVAPAATWLLTRGYRRGGGPLDLEEAPA